MKRMALDGAEERARPRRGPCTLDSPTQCTSPGLSFYTLILVTHRHADSSYFNNYRASRERETNEHRIISSTLDEFCKVNLKMPVDLRIRLYNFQKISF